MGRTVAGSPSSVLSRAWHTWHTLWVMELEQLKSPLAKYLQECNSCAPHRMLAISGKSLSLAIQAGIAAGNAML